MSNKLEIEIKSLLWEKANADKLLENISKKFPEYKFTNQEKQLNHYFKDWNFELLYSNLDNLLNDDQKSKLKNIVEFGKKHSVRTRWIDKTWEVILVIKAAIDDTTSHNWIQRIEFEAKFNNMPLDQLDKILLDSWFNYLSKWSRERQEYSVSNINVSLDKNAWYGYLAEFEMVIDANDDFNAATENLRQIMAELGTEELAQDRLERMFAFYNENWPDYYGTEKVFTIL